MSLGKNCLAGWRDFLGLARDRRREAVEILQLQYTAAMQRAGHLSCDAATMPYPQFREKLLRIAAEETARSEQIAQKITSLGGRLPALAAAPPSGGNSWRSLLADLREQQYSAASLWEQMHGIGADFPDVAELLQNIYEDGKRHRAEIVDLMMRSDPQAFSAG